MLKLLKQRSQKRRVLLAQQLGVSHVTDIPNVLGYDNERSVNSSNDSLIDKNIIDNCNIKASPSSSSSSQFSSQLMAPSNLNVLSDIKEYKKSRNESMNVNDECDPKKAKVDSNDELNDTEDVTTYTDSSTFLKGTQSENPHNDYCQHFVDTGQRPQNFIRDVGITDRFEEYPKLKELIRLKDELISQTATPPMYLKCDLKEFDLHELKCKFDVILIEPPIEEYGRTHGVTNTEFWTWDDVMKLQIEDIAAQRSFVFLWCGSSDGLDLGRQCLRKWGFRRCEDICWIKTNIKSPGHSKNLELKAIFQRTKEHCLMGIKGTVRRSTDGDFIHANIDIDLIISEESEYGSIQKPEEIFHIIEHFCLGRRRLHVFGRDTTIRPGWLTIGPGLTNSNFNSETYGGNFNKNPDDFLTGCTERIEALRPKSPPPKAKGQTGQRTNRGAGNSASGGIRRTSRQ